ncbi:MAG: hypothetical protein PWR01_3901, partial [Clostridiales bacterium]|nr:hypothetical protein [Clostridiales bacterium]MDN5282828.1 hypothetical protein [Candidatus Ozemobacter sp.]
TGDTVSRVTELLHERRDKAAGKARVAAGSYDNSELVMKESEQEALGDAALAEFMAMSGMDTTVTPDDVETVEPIPERGMGPMEKN